MKIAIFGRITDNTDYDSLYTFFSHISKRKLEFTLYQAYQQQLSKAYPELLQGLEFEMFSLSEEIRDCKFIYCLGGDGTVLEAVRFTGPLSIPIMGINFGRLGYLASASKQEVVQATEELLNGQYKIDERSLLYLSAEPDELFGEDKFALNDLSILKSNTNEMITVHAYVNGEFLNTYWGDGVIVGTPTGSTAYSLSCGGPIIFPNSGNFVITPVAPHSLTVRPVIIPDDWVVSFRIESRSGLAMISLDSRTEQVSTPKTIAVRLAPFKVKLIRVSTTSYINNLRKSLMWGSDNRN